MNEKKQEIENIGFENFEIAVKKTMTPQNEATEAHVNIDNPLLGSDKKKSATKPKNERKTYSREEAKEATESLKTRGKKGCELPRLNVGFTDRNVIYIKVMSSVSGQTITEFINALVNKSFEENREAFQAAMDIRKKFSPDNLDFELTENITED